MAKKRQKKRTAVEPRPHAGGSQPSYWMIVAVIFFFFAAGLAVKMVFAPVQGTGIVAGNAQGSNGVDTALEGQVRLVAANFRCACGGCGELFLIDCTCDMPKGAVEEKNFIRNKLQQGLTVDQVIDLVNQEYGHKIA